MSKTREICGITFVAVPADKPAEWREVWRNDHYDITLKVPSDGRWTVTRAPGRNVVSALPVEKALADVLRDIARDHAKTAPLIQHAVAWAAQHKEPK